jgi:A/G-specific adenine glycosylase
MVQIDPSIVTDIQAKLHAWYRAYQRRLPWRSTREPYEIWVSEVMLQQTQVKTVVPYYRRFLKRFPDLAALAAADLELVLKLWEGLGYYARARNLHRAARVVVGTHGSVIPDQWKDFRQLPGAGDYISAAVLSIAFDRPHAVVDGNVKRVLARLLVLETPVNQGAAGIFKAAAEALLDASQPGLHNQALMEVGALICKPKNPQCPTCPLNPQCRAWLEGRVTQFPKRRASRKVPTQRVAVGVVVRKGRVLITRRPNQGLLGGLWEFPGGRIEPSETPAQACVREIAEETGLSVGIVAHLAAVKHAYTHFKVEVAVFICAYQGGEVRLNGPVDHRWIRLDQMEQFAFPKANHKFMPKLKAFIKNS